MSSKPKQISSVTNFGIIYGSSARPGIPSAGTTAGLAHKLVNKWLQSGFENVYVLMDIKNPWKGDKRVKVLRPTAFALRQAVGEIKAAHTKKDPKKNITNVHIKVKDHGGGAGKDHTIGYNTYFSAAVFVKIVNDFQAEIQRIFEFSQCDAASMQVFKKNCSKYDASCKSIRDRNDLLMIHSGIVPDPNKKGKVIKYESNWDDGRDLGSLKAPDINGDGVISNSEMFWKGMKNSLALSVNKIFPWSRGFVFDQGPDFIDFGFGKKAAKPPFPDTLVEIKDKYDPTKPNQPHGLVTLLDNISSSHPKGISVYAFDRSHHYSRQEWPAMIPRIKSRLNSLAKQYKGIVQVVWVEPETATKFFSHNSRDSSLTYLFRYHGVDINHYMKDLDFKYDETKDFRKMTETLKGILSGETPKAKNSK